MDNLSFITRTAIHVKRHDWILISTGLVAHTLWQVTEVKETDNRRVEIHLSNVFTDSVKTVYAMRGDVVVIGVRE